MRHLELSSVNHVAWSGTDPPGPPGSSAALVRPVAVGVCDFDRAVIAGVLQVLPLPIELGHEIVAEVLEVGDTVRSVTPGTRVIVPMQVSCGVCVACRHGRTNSCASVPRLSNYGLGRGGGGYGGGMSDTLVVPYADSMLVPIPEDAPPADYAAAGCNLTEAYRCLEPVRSRPEATVLVLGGHGANLGYYTVVLAQHLGAAHIAYLADDPDELATAADLGAEPVAGAKGLRHSGYDAVVDVSLDPARLATGLAHCAPDGTCAMPWFYSKPAMIPLQAMFPNNALLSTGQAHIRGLLDAVVPLVSSRAFTSTSIPVEILDWDTAHRTYGRADVKRIYLR